MAFSRKGLLANQERKRRLKVTVKPAAALGSIGEASRFE
jgi:hypothetical protein